MSLLMKALANAEENKRVLIQQEQKEDREHQQAAANIFTASQNNPASFGMLINGLIALIVIGILWFSYKLYQLNQIPSNLALNTLPAAQQPIAQGRLIPEPSRVQAKTVMVQPVEKHTQPAKISKQSSTTQTNATKNKKQNKAAETTISKQVKKLSEAPVKTVTTGKIDAFSETQIIEAPEAPTKDNIARKPKIGPTQITVEHRAGDMVLDQRLQDAYQAFVSGNPKKAKSLYRSVLKQDIYQTDALLGMAAIAQKQGRFADAAGWYQKTLATDPNNPAALAGLAATSPQQDARSQELRLQQLISKQPYHAQHYANLGNLYASQHSWTKAQAAFFDANRHDKQNAQFAFNLAVSLEHLGKPSLAVQHYQRALTLVKSQNLSVPSESQIRQRLEVLQ